MARWEPGSRDKLRDAALDLYAGRGFEATTVAEIAERAGLTKRTFFRHFADKREVLFAGSEVLEAQLTRAAAAAPDAATPLEAVAAGVAAAGAFFTDLELSRRRQAIIAAHPDLQERELIKLASLTDAFAAVLRERGTPEPAAGLAAQAGVAIFRSAFERWLADGDTRDYASLVRDTVEDFRAIAIDAGPATRR